MFNRFHLLIIGLQTSVLKLKFSIKLKIRRYTRISMSIVDIIRELWKYFDISLSPWKRKRRGKKVEEAWQSLETSGDFPDCGKAFVDKF